MRLDPSEYLSSSSDSEDVIVAPDDAIPDWDNYGTDLECSVAKDDPIAYRSIPLDQAINLDLVLPLTSTPVPAPGSAWAPRVSALRRQLPCELDKKESSFLSRLNPFRKKN